MRKGRRSETGGSDSAALRGTTEDIQVVDTDTAFHEADPSVEDAVSVSDAPTIGVIGSNIEIEAGPTELSSNGAKHAKEKAAPPIYIQKSRRMRKILIVIIILLIVLLGAGVFLSYQLFQTAQTAAQQQSQAQSDTEAFNNDEATKDASTSVARKTTVPNLVQLLGMNVDQAIEALQHGAQVTSTVEVNEEGNPIKQEVRIGLTAEPSDTRSGTPTIYLSLDEAGTAIQSGYSVATSALGYGSLSFIDAIKNEHIIEKTLQEAGLDIPPDSVVLPEDKMLYSTYASDGTTLTKETYSFEGNGVADGDMVMLWNAILTYDYATANASGNLADTIRTIYIYVSTIPLNSADTPDQPTA